MRGEPPWTSHSHSHTHTLIVASDSHSTVLRVQQMASSDDELTWSEAQIADCIIKRKLRVQLTIFQQKTEQVSVELITHCDSQTAKMRKKTQTHTRTHISCSLSWQLSLSFRQIYILSGVSDTPDQAERCPSCIGCVMHNVQTLLSSDC